ncbi:MAG: fibronectin type III domain-containing protein [Bacteroidota bacterium]
MKTTVKITGLRAYLAFAILGILLSSELTAGTRFFRLSYRDDPATTIVVGWCDKDTSANAQVYYGTVDYDTNYLSYPLSHGVDRSVISYYGLNHRFARLTQLTPNTVYYFVVRDHQGVSARMCFKTLPDNANTPITFIAGGDSRTALHGEPDSLLCRPRRQDANRLVSKISPDFITFSGDYVLAGYVFHFWADWFTDWQLTMTPEGRLFPLVPTLGNHEDSNDLYNLFDIPDSTSYYSLSIAGKLLRIYTLNTDIKCDNTQRSWLENDLQMHTGNINEPYWKFVQYHYPFAAHAGYPVNHGMINCWASLFQDYKVKLVAESHAHVIKFTWPILTSSAAESDSGFIRNDSLRIVYIGEGSWGAPLRNLHTTYSPDAAFNWTRNQEKMPGFQVVCVAKEKIEVRVIKIENVENVGQVGLNDPPCTLPANIVLWNPSNGSVVNINNPNALSGNAALLNLNISQGALNPAFSSTQYNYAVLLADTAVVPPGISVTLADPNATVQLTQASNLSGSVAERTATALVVAEDGITSHTYSVIFYQDHSGVQEISAGKAAVIYPNPAGKEVHIDFFDKNSTAKVEVYNAYGCKIKSLTVTTGNTCNLDISSYSTGIYYVYITMNKFRENYKISVVK